MKRVSVLALAGLLVQACLATIDKASAQNQEPVPRPLTITLLVHGVVPIDPGLPGERLPIEAAEVSIESANGPIGQFRTGGDGTIRFEAAPTDLDVVVTAQDTTLHWATATCEIVHNSASQLAIELHLTEHRFGCEPMLIVSEDELSATLCEGEGVGEGLARLGLRYVPLPGAIALLGAISLPEQPADCT